MIKQFLDKKLFIYRNQDQKNNSDEIVTNNDQSLINDRVANLTLTKSGKSSESIINPFKSNRRNPKTRENQTFISSYFRQCR